MEALKYLHALNAEITAKSLPMIAKTTLEH